MSESDLELGWPDFAFAGAALVVVAPLWLFLAITVAVVQLVKAAVAILELIFGDVLGPVPGAQ